MTMACATPPTNPPANAAVVREVPHASSWRLVNVLPNMNIAPTNAPSMVRLDVPVHNAGIPPSRTSFCIAVIILSFETVTRVLIFSRGVPPLKSEAIRSKAPRIKVFPIERCTNTVAWILSVPKKSSPWSSSVSAREVKSGVFAMDRRFLRNDGNRFWRGWKVVECTADAVTNEWWLWNTRGDWDTKRHATMIKWMGFRHKMEQGSRCNKVVGCCVRHRRFCILFIWLRMNERLIGVRNYRQVEAMGLIFRAMMYNVLITDVWCSFHTFRPTCIGYRISDIGSLRSIPCDKRQCRMDRHS